MRARLLTGGLRVSLDPPAVSRADVAIEGGRIARSTGPAEIIDVSGCLVLPGFVVAHTHLYSGLARGMPGAGPPPSSFREILERVWWRLDRALDPASLAASAEVAAIEALRSGVTCLVDHHESPSFIDGSLDVIEQAVRSVGLRAVLGYGATDRHGEADARRGLDESLRFAKKTAADPLVRGAIALHAPFTCSDRTIDRAASDAQSTGAWLHLHAAEGPDDQRAARERWRTRLVPGLEARGILSERAILAHAVDVDAEEAKAIDRSGAWLVHQARSNMNNGVGYARSLFDLPRVALGTDGIDDDPFEELRAAFFRGREASGPTVWRDPVRMLSNAHRLASAIFGASLGSLEPGAPADLVVLDYDPPTPLTAETLGAHLLFGLSSRYVRDVFVAGEPVLRDRRLTKIDGARAIANARRLAPELWARMGS